MAIKYKYVTVRKPGATPRQVDHARKKAKFLESFRKTGGSFALSAAATGVARNTIWRWRDEDPEFAEACALVVEMDTDRLEIAGRKRALQKSDLLTMFFLKAKRPQTYGAPGNMDGQGKGVSIDHKRYEGEEGRKQLEADLRAELEYFSARPTAEARAAVAGGDGVPRGAPAAAQADQAGA